MKPKTFPALAIQTAPPLPTEPDARRGETPLGKAQVWNCGGGLQSAAIAALILQHRLPIPDRALIVDTGRECQTTWEYLANVLQPSLPFQIERVPAERYAYSSSVWSKNLLLIPAFTTQVAGRVGKLDNFCTRWWKLDAIRSYLSKVHGLTRSKYRSWIGLSSDEPRRYLRMMAGGDYKAGLIFLPLVEKGITRPDALAIIRSMGWPAPPRSRCWICPNQSDEEWRELKRERPGEFEQACAEEELFQQRDPHAFLHKQGIPLRNVEFSQASSPSTPCDSGVCFI